MPLFSLGTRAPGNGSWHLEPLVGFRVSHAHWRASQHLVLKGWDGVRMNLCKSAEPEDLRHPGDDHHPHHHRVGPHLGDELYVHRRHHHEEDDVDLLLFRTAVLHTSFLSLLLLHRLCRQHLLLFFLLESGHPRARGERDHQCSHSDPGLLYR